MLYIHSGGKNFFGNNVLTVLSCMLKGLSVHCNLISFQFKKSDECSRCGDSNWHAAGNNRTKKKNLSETGLEISGCRHGLQ